ncbi:MAG: DUF4347 domain-containing protein [Moritella sp.]|uniref:DUF4347 domain-containing protein n=1 Tax=Moritella sp. TaxID=78556 RepID=UPI0029A5DE2A|nr:DUF4347 domain-containing protein [Moritella sp.]MDX2321571.1 DUF4347 domain-containing protein [Moritella sp.]
MNKYLLSTIAAATLPMGLNNASAQLAGAYTYIGSRNRGTGIISSFYEKAQPLHAPVKLQQAPVAISELDISVPKSTLTSALSNRNNVSQRLTKQGDLELVAHVPVNELIIIDAAVPDKHLFYKKLKNNIEIKEINSQQDGLEQLKAILSGYQNLDALHLVSHADDGVIYLGNSQVTMQLLKNEITVLSSLDNALKDGADLLLYGCDLAKSKKGEDLIELISTAANIDVLASNDLTGSGVQGSDWDLEIQIGNIETDKPFSEIALRNFGAVLAAGGTIDMTGFSSINGYGKYRASSNYDFNGYTLELSGNISSGRWFSGVQYGYGVYVNAYGDSAFSKVYFNFSADETFDATSIYVFNSQDVNKSFKITSDKGDVVNSSTLASHSGIAGTGETVTLTGFTGISKLTIENSDGSDLSFIKIDDLVVTNVTAAASNASPTDISLSSISVDQSLGVNASVGTLTSTDADVGDSHTYSLISGSGDTDNSSFTINGNALTANDAAALTAGSYTILINTNDGTDNFSKSFTITVTDNIAPLLSTVSIPNSSHKVGDTVTTTITAATDSDDYTTGSGGIIGTINGYLLSNLTKVSDTQYTANFTITDGGADAAASDTIAVNLTLTDSAGNSSSTYTSAISQESDALYANLPEISLTADSNTIAEAGGVSTLTATLSNSLNNQWPVDVSVGLGYSGTATLTTDYAGATSITIAAGSSSNTTPLTGVSDSLYDAASAETIIADISTVSAGSKSTTAQQTISIADAQSAPTVTLSTSTDNLAENGGSSTVTATLSHATYETVTVDLAYSGTATSGSDYATPSATITIAAGDTTADTSTGLSSIDDADGEGNETIILAVATVSGGGASESGTQQQTVTITDDEDTAAPLLSTVSIPNSSHKVGDTVTATITVATDSDDYTSGSGDITGTINGYLLSSLTKVSDTQYTASFTITDGGADAAAGDTIAVNLTLTDSAGNSSSTYTSAISQGSDALYANLPEISLTADTNTITEDGGVSILTATLSNSLNNQWPVDVTTNLTYTGTASAVTDYSKSDSIVISAGNSSNTATVTGTADTVFDAAIDETAIVDISTLSAGNEGSTNQQTLTITDAESAPTVTLSVGSSPVVEDGGTSTITATLDTATYADVVVNLGYTGTATSGGTDYNTPSSSITIPAGSLTATAITGITTVDDVNADGDQTIIIDVASVSGGSATESGTQQQTIIITDDDDGAAPVFDSMPSLSNITAEGADLSVNMDEEGTVYYLIVNNGAATPTAAQVKSGASYNSVTVYANGNITTIGTVGSRTITGLSDGVDYDVYVVGEDSVANLQSDVNVVKLALTTPDTLANITSIALSGTPAETATSVMFSVVFGDDVTNVTTTDFTATLVSGESNIVPTITSISGSGTTYNVTVNAGVTIGELRLDLNANTDIVDENSNTPDAYSSGVVHTVNTNNKPTVSEATSNVGPFTIDEDIKTALDLSDVLIADGNDDSLIVTISVGNGLIFATDGNTTVNATTITGSDSNGSSNITLMGLSTDINAFLNDTSRISFQTDENDTASVLFTITANDNLETSTALTETITINAINDAPTISGTPTTTLVDGNAYSFTPTANDIDGDTPLTFIITNKPDWAAFDRDTGALTGVPQPADVDTTVNIVIRVEDPSGEGNELAAFDLEITSSNSAPVISGTPLTTTAEDAPYRFTPTVTDVDSGDTKVFSITNKPSWATFSSVTGELSGMPSNSNLGTTNNITITVTDGIGAQDSLTAFNLTVTNVNDAPVISGTPAITVAEDTSYSFTPAVTDVDSGDTKTFSISNKPSWAIFSSTTGGLSGTPTNDNIGTTSNIIITVTDSSNASASLSAFSLTVTNENDAPVITGSPTTTIAEDAAYSFTPTVVDVDSGDTKTFSISNKPNWASFSAATGTLSGTPTNDNIGTTNNIVITVTDGSGVAVNLSSFNLTVTNENDAPVITGSPVTTIAEDAAYNFTPTVVDVDSGDTKTFSISNKPNWASFSAATGTLSGTPSNDHIGTTNNIVITVTDGSGVAVNLSSFNLTVTNENDAPVITGSPATTIAEDAAYNFTPTVVDVDSGDTKTFSISNKPNWASFSAATGTLSGTPTNDDIGVTNGIVIKVKDGSNASANLGVFSLTVTNENDAPVITGSPITTVAEDVAYSFTPTVIDVDSGDTQTFSISNKPSWASFSTTTGLLSGTPVNDDVGATAGIVITVTDGSNVDASLEAFELTVTNVNDAPVAEDDVSTIKANGDDLYTLSVLGNDSDDDGDELVIEGADADLGSVTVVNNELLYQADADFIGTVKLTYSINDGNDARDSAIVTLSIEDAVQSQAPTITAPDDIVVNATGLYTKVITGTATATDRNGDPIAVSLVDNNLLFSPGTHELYWQATDALGVRSVASQQVTVHPLISLSKDQIVHEGNEVEVQAILNGRAPSYPVILPYSITIKTGGVVNNVIDEDITINEGQVATISLSEYQFSAGETVIVTLASGLNLGTQASTKVVISEDNIAPVLTFNIEQNGEIRQTVSQADGDVTIQAIVTDANPGNTVTVTWESETLADLDNDETIFRFAPSDYTAGSYSLTAVATDNGTPILSVTSHIFVDIKTSLVALTNEQDTDGDNIPDLNEGYGDDDGDGIPNYQDSNKLETCNVVPETLNTQTQFLVEGEPGVCLRKGLVSLNSVQGGLQVNEGELAAIDTEAKNVGGLFDYIAYGLPQAGQVYKIVFPQLLPIPRGAVYRKYSNNVWMEFVVDADNKLLSATGEQGYCPPPGDQSWVEGLQENHWCVQLQIQDGGPNDDDGIANGTIIDPGGVSVLLNGNAFPVAEDDNVSLIQNTEITVTVLDNDSDVNGDVLAVANASAVFGSVVINGQQSITYTPTMDYVGRDTIAYTINDGNGGTAIAQVNVTVTPPDASAVSNKSKGGSMSWFFSYGLLLIAFGRKYGARVLTIVLAMLSFNTRADDDIVISKDTANTEVVASSGSMLAPSDKDKWSIALNSGISRLHGNSNVSGIPAENIVDIDDQGISWGITLGYRMSQNWSVSVGYLDLGEASTVLQSNTFNYHQSVAQVTPIFGDGIVLGLNYQFWQHHKFSSEVMAGAFAWRSQIDSTFEDVTIEHKQDGIDPYVGGALAYALSDDWKVGLEMKRYFLDANDVDNFSLILAYQF